MKGTRKCKVCGKEYPYCTTLRKGVFRWQDVACCPEHAEIYLARITESRAKKKQDNASNGESATPVKESIKDTTKDVEEQTPEADEQVAVNDEPEPEVNTSVNDDPVYGDNAEYFDDWDDDEEDLDDEEDWEDDDDDDIYYW